MEKGKICVGLFSFGVNKNLSSMGSRNIFDNVGVLCVAQETSEAPRKNSACRIRLMPQRYSPEPPVS